tara:strand:- start:1783 stop:2610 length:828 start_codon:yes stop_codon:yes gene_type:complete
MITIMEMIKMYRLKYLFLALFIINCSSSIVPGISEPNARKNSVYLPEKKISIPIVDVSEKTIFDINKNDLQEDYTISPGDVLTFTVWGLNDIFPVVGFAGQSNNPINSRTVGPNGEIYFPYVGKIKLANYTIEEARDIIASLLAEQFVEPQIDLTISKFNENRKAYLLGELLRPQPIYIGIEKISLTDAIGVANGLDPKFSNAKKVYVIRSNNNEEIIYRFDLSSSEKFLISNDFHLKPKDVVYVSASSVTKWNRVFAQIFPFASFLNQVDNISQ